jgi:hypothetical protein
MNHDDNHEDILAFLDHGLERFHKNPDGKNPVMTERYKHYPKLRLEDYKTDAAKLPIPQGHSEKGGCPSWTQHPKGTVVARLVGRALGKDGKPVADTARQANYIEDRFHITISTQEKLAKALGGAKTERVTLPLEVTREWVKHAYLGVLDVRPLDNQDRKNGDLKKCDFGAQKVATGKGLTLWRVEGESEVYIDDKTRQWRPGDMHWVKLKWHGFIEMDENRITRLVLSADGSERLKFVSLFNMNCQVRFGIIGEAIAGAPAAAQDVPEEARKHLLHELGGPFFVSRDKVQEELKLSDDQKKKLREKLSEDVQETRKVLSLKVGERDKAMQSLRQSSSKKLAVFLKEILTPEQLKRFQQLELQYDMPAIMLRPEIVKELKITDEQRQQFIGVIQAMQRKIEPLMKEARSAGNPQEILPKVIRLRLDCQGQIEALLSETQRKQWQEMTGKPFVIW